MSYAYLEPVHKQMTYERRPSNLQIVTFCTSDIKHQTEVLFPQSAANFRDI